MTDSDKLILQAEHDAIEKLFAGAATEPPAVLEKLQREYGERLGHLKARLAAPTVPVGALSKKTT